MGWLAPQQRSLSHSLCVWPETRRPHDDNNDDDNNNDDDDDDDGR